VLIQATFSQWVKDLRRKKFWKIHAGTLRNSYYVNIGLKRKLDKGFYDLMPCNGWYQPIFLCRLAQSLASMEIQFIDGCKK
jgi:hypothetical protein